MKLQSIETAVADDHVLIILTYGQAEIEEAKSYLIARVPRPAHPRCDASPNRKYLSAIQAEVLRTLQDAISDQINEL